MNEPLQINQNEFLNQVNEAIDVRIGPDEPVIVVDDGYPSKTEYLNKSPEVLVAERDEIKRSIEELEESLTHPSLFQKIFGWHNRKKKKLRTLTQRLNQVEKSIAEAYSERLYREQADQIVEEGSIRRYLCPALQSVSNDAHDIAKVAVPILFPLILTGTIAIPLNPVLIGWVCIIIARMGIASLCADYKKEDKR